MITFYANSIYKPDSLNISCFIYKPIDNPL